MILILRSTRFLMGTSIGLDVGCTRKMILQEEMGATTPYMRVVPPVPCLPAMCKLLVLRLPKQEALHSVGSSFD